MTRKQTVRRWSLALALLALGALALAGCGGGSSSSSESTTASTGSASSGAAGKGPRGFAISGEARACLKEKGVELPEFKAGAGGPPQGGEGGEPPEGFQPPGEGATVTGGKGFEKMQKALEECGVEMGEFKAGPGKGSPDVNAAAFKKQIEEYAACVRENGYQLAEPNFSGAGPVFEKSESESPAFKRASAKCQDLLGRPGAEG
jgi:hypothetical protein